MSQSRAHIRATTKFENKAYEKITVRIRKDKPDTSGLTREIIAEAAESSGYSVNGFILEAIKEKIYQGTDKEELERQPFFDDP